MFGVWWFGSKMYGQRADNCHVTDYQPHVSFSPERLRLGAKAGPKWECNIALKMQNGTPVTLPWGRISNATFLGPKILYVQTYIFALLRKIPSVVDPIKITRIEVVPFRLPPPY